jgi:hypothetical protein
LIFFFWCISITGSWLDGTHAKISHLVTSLPTSRQQVVFALLVPSCQQRLEQAVNNL